MGKLKILVGLFAALAILVVANTAYAYVASWLNQSLEVKEPIQASILNTTSTGAIYPGEVFTTTLEVKNIAPNSAYGMAYDGWVGWVWYNVEGREEMKFPLGSQPAKNGVLQLEKPEQPVAAAAGGMGYYGTVRLDVDPDGAGPGEWRIYTPSQRVDLPAGGTHFVRAVVRSSTQLPPGTWTIYFAVDRGEPSS